jgi:tripartite ATP-independent transporter DctM subunit
MSPELLAILMILSFFALLALGAHLSWTMLTLGFVFGWLAFGPSIIPLTLLRFWDIIGSFSLLAIPLFVFMANVLSSSGIADDLFETLNRCAGGLKAGLGIVVGGGALGYMIPPSIMFILYGLFAGVSIGSLFIAGIIPGLLLVVLYSIYIWIRALLRPEVAPSLTKEERYSFVEKLTMARSLALPSVLVVAVLGSIYLGIATVGEAAGVGAAGSILASAAHRKLTWTSLVNALVGTMKTVGVIMWITLSAYAFAGVVTRLGAGTMLVDALEALALGSWGTLITLILILVVLGMIIDVVGLVVLTVPIFAPVIVALGYDPLWFGILFNMTIQIGFLSPPFGYGMFYLKAVAPPDVSTLDLYRSVAPFIGLQVLAMAIIMVFPPIATYLPSLMQ